MSKQKVKGTFAETQTLKFITRNWYGIDDSAVDDEFEIEVNVISYSLRYPSAQSERYPLSLSPDEYDSHPDKGALLESLYEPKIETTGESDYAAEGVPWRRIASLGGKDTGDIDGPFTIIEVKNYSDPPLSGLLSNAEWKASNTTKPLWLLVYKAAGKGTKRVGEWHVMMTASALFERYGVRLPAQPLLGADDLIEMLPQWCKGAEEHDGAFFSPVKGREFPPLTWTPRLHFSNMKAKIPERRETMWKTISKQFNETDRILPFIISPRRDCSPDRWFVYTKLSVACRMLETVGVLPTIGDKITA